MHATKPEKVLATYQRRFLAVLDSIGGSSHVLACGRDGTLRFIVIDDRRGESNVDGAHSQRRSRADDRPVLDEDRAIHGKARAGNHDHPATHKLNA